jgi:Tfp pilus assembly protein PilF
MVKTRTAAMKAVALDDELVYGHSMLGFVAFQYDWNFEAAEREYKRAIALQPSFVHQWYARYLLAMNRPAEAEAEYHRYLVRSSSSVSGMTHVAEFEYLTRQYGRAGAQLHDTLSLDPNYAPAHEILGLVYEQQGHQESAREELQKAVELSRGFVALGSLGHLYAAQGRSADVQKTLADLAAQSKERYVAPFELALIHTGLGKSKAAIDDLEKGYQDRSLSAQSLRFDPRLDSVRSEPRFHEFVKRIGLPF